MLAVIFAARRKNQRWDLEALETATRAALHQAGAKLLEQLLEAPPRAEPEQPCDCGRRARYRGQRPKKIKTVLGEVEIERPYYLCAAGHQGQFPCDRELDVEDTQYSPGVRRMMALVGSESSFEGGREQLRRLAVPQLPQTRFIHRLGSDRGRLPDGDRATPQAIGHVLDRTGRQRDPRAALCPPQRPLRRLLGKPRPGRLIGTFMSHTRPRVVQCKVMLNGWSVSNAR